MPDHPHPEPGPETMTPDEIVASFGCFTGDCPHEYANQCIDAVEKEIVKRIVALQNTVAAITDWKDDGEDHPELLVGPVLVRPEVVRRWVAAEDRLNQIAEIIEAVDDRALAADGPVTPTDQEIRLHEIQEIYRIATLDRKRKRNSKR